MARKQGSTKQNKKRFIKKVEYEKVGYEGYCGIFIAMLIWSIVNQLLKYTWYENLIFLILLFILMIIIGKVFDRRVYYEEL